MNYSNFEQGDIVVTDVRFSDTDETKPRPAIIMSNNAYNRSSNDLILFKITGTKKNWKFDVNLQKESLKEGELLKESVIKADFPIVVNKKRIKQKIGKARENIIKEVIAKFQEVIKNN